MLSHWPARQGVLTGTMAQCSYGGRAANQFPTGLREFMPGQKTMAWEVIGPPWGEPTTAVLLNGHVVRLSSKYLTATFAPLSMLARDDSCNSECRLVMADALRVKWRLTLTPKWNICINHMEARGASPKREWKEWELEDGEESGKVVF